MGAREREGMQPRRRPSRAGRRSAASPRPGAPAGAKPSGLTAGDIMVRQVRTVRPETPVDDVSQLFQVHNIHGAPVVDGDGLLVGIVTEDDLVFGEMGLSDGELASRERRRRAGARQGEAKEKEEEDREAQEDGDPPGSALGLTDPEDRRHPRLVGEIMTPRPFAAEERTPVEELCRLMCRLKIHRLPIVRKGKVTGIVSSIDICRLVAEGRVRLVPTGG